MPYDIGGGLIPSGEDMLKEAQVNKLKAEAAKISDEMGRDNLKRIYEPPQNFTPHFAKGGPVTGKYTKGTGAVNIGDWVAPMKSRGNK